MTATSTCLIERLCQIGNQIIGIFDAAGNTDHIVGNAILFSLFGRAFVVAHHQRLFDQRFNTAQTGPDAGNLYGIDGNSNAGRTCKVVCMDWKTGDVNWEHRGLGCGSLLVAGGKLIVLGDKGELVTAEATADAFRRISSARVLEGKCWTVPVLARGRIYCRNAAGDLVCLDVRK